MFKTRYLEEFEEEKYTTSTESVIYVNCKMGDKKEIKKLYMKLKAQ